MEEHSRPPFMPESHLMVGCASHAALPHHPQIVVMEWGLLLSPGTIGVHFWEGTPIKEPPEEQWRASPSLKAGLSPLVCAWRLWQEVRLRCPCPHAPVAAFPSGLMPRKVPTSEPCGMWMLVFAHLVLGAWEPLLAWVSVAISVPPVCWENVRTSPDSLQSQELHCLNLCQLCF